MAKKIPSGASRQKKQVLPDVPDKLYYRIGEVARLCGVETYVLRFWETEFPQLKPNKSGAGQRLYRRREVDLARRIRHLLYEEGYTIPGARQAIQVETRKPGEARKSDENGQLALVDAGLKSRDSGLRLSRVRAELKEILGMLSGSSTARGRERKSEGENHRDGQNQQLFD
jgi:DNA-binding transcriptional MerR regulator